MQIIETFMIPVNDNYNCRNKLQHLYAHNQNIQLRNCTIRYCNDGFVINSGKDFLCNRVMDIWNILPEELTSTTSIT